MKLDSRELATVLAALRYWQNDLEEDEEMYNVIDGNCHFEEHKPLSPEEIDSLCERINVTEAETLTMRNAETGSSITGYKTNSDYGTGQKPTLDALIEECRQEEAAAVSPYIVKARDYWEMCHFDYEIRIPDDAKIDDSPHDGAWVEARVWVPNE